MFNLALILRQSSWPAFKILSWHSRGGNEEKHENLSHDSRPSGHDLNPGPPEFETGAAHDIR